MHFQYSAGNWKKVYYVFMFFSRTVLQSGFFRFPVLVYLCSSFFFFFAQLFFVSNSGFVLRLLLVYSVVLGLVSHFHV